MEINNTNGAFSSADVVDPQSYPPSSQGPLLGVRNDVVAAKDSGKLFIDTRPKIIDDSVPPAIEQWLNEQGLNDCGDPKDVFYLGGTPLFNESTGRRIPRLDYILWRHPQLAYLVPGRNPELGRGLPGSSMHPLPYSQGVEQMRKMLEQMMKMLHNLLGSFLPKLPYNQMKPTPYLFKRLSPTPQPANAVLQRQILQVRSSLSQLRSNIAEYTKLGKPVPTRLKIRLMILEERQAKLEARAAKPMNPPRFFDTEGYKVTSDSVNTKVLTPQQQLESGGTQAISAPKKDV